MIEPKRRLGCRTLIVVITLSVSVGIAATCFEIAFLDQSPCPSGTTQRSFLVISNYNGFNDSKDHPLTLNAQKNECVLVTVENRDTQTHGLTVQTYAPHGVDVRPGETESLRFYADSTGGFSISEPVSSTIYVFDRGVFNVTYP